MNTKSKEEVLDRLEQVLNDAADLTEALRPEVFAAEEDYWRVRRCVSEAGGLVCSEYGRLRCASRTTRGRDD